MPNFYLHANRAVFTASAFAFIVTALAQAQQPGPAITLAGSPSSQAADSTHSGKLARAPEYRQFGRAKVGEHSEPEVFVLNVQRATTITGITASNDFHIDGGTCIEGHSYAAHDVCSVEVIFTPQGPGHRTGVLTVTHSASPQPMLAQVTGEAEGPVISFMPAEIEPVPGTLVSGKGLLLNAQGLAVDGGNTLYIADTGNNLIRSQDSSGVLNTVAGGGTATGNVSFVPPTTVELAGPYGIAVDPVGDVWFTDTGNTIVRVVGPLTLGTIETEVGGGTTTDGCSQATPCNPTSISLPTPFSLAFDSSGNLFLNYFYPGTAGVGAGLGEDAGGIFGQYFGLGYLFEGGNASYPMAFDAANNLYYPFEFPPIAEGVAQCLIFGQNQAATEGAKTGAQTWRAAGTGKCGFGGDGGPADGAEISSSVQGLAVDAAGNLYFSDTGNNRIRRIDAATGIIRTIAGNGAAAYGGDYGSATDAAVWAPTGVATDSMGNVYTIAQQDSSGAGVVRYFGAHGLSNFPAVLVGSPSAAQTVMVSNVGNDALNFIHESFFGSNPGDFAIDPNTTSCNFAAPLNSGQSCLVGIIFKPSAAGARSASLKFLDNTVSGSNFINLSGTGTTAAKAALAPTSLTFASRPVGSSSPTQSVKLTNSGGLSLSITSYGFTGTDSGDFSQTHTCGMTLAGGGSCTISVKFKPTASGTRTGKLSVVTSAGTVTTSLSGKATLPQVESTVTLAAKINPAKTGQAVVLTSKVAASGAKSPTGTVQLKEGENVLAKATLDKDSVTFKVSSLAAGTHVLNAYYMGDSLHEPASSPVVKQVVK